MEQDVSGNGESIMAIVRFKCLKCAQCCRNLFKDYNGITQGLGLSLEEINLFSDNLILPQAGIGWGISGPKHITGYQLNVNTCPHLSENKSCRIHEKRPAVCRAFPLISAGIDTLVADSDDCTFVREIEKKIGLLDNIFPLTQKKFEAPNEWQAISTINTQLMNPIINHPNDAQVLWLFDLKTKEWQISQA